MPVYRPAASSILRSFRANGKRHLLLTGGRGSGKTTLIQLIPRFYDATEGAVLIDGDSGRILFGQNENERFAMASTTKIMTALLALENCALDETWVFYTEEQIAEINGFLTEGTSDEDMKKLMEENQSVQDMYASSTDGLMTMNITYQNLGLLSGSSTRIRSRMTAQQCPGAGGRRFRIRRRMRPL